MKYFRTSIPVKTYVRKYIEHTFPTPLKITTKNTLGMIVHSILTTDTARFYDDSLNEQTPVRYRILTDSITVLLPRTGHTLYRTGFEIDHYRATMLNDFYEYVIQENLNSYCVNYEKRGWTQRQAIEDFAEAHGIILEIDISYDALRQAEFRYRKRLKKITELCLRKLSHQNESLMITDLAAPQSSALVTIKARY